MKAIAMNSRNPNRRKTTGSVGERRKGERRSTTKQYELKLHEKLKKGRLETGTMTLYTPKVIKYAQSFLKEKKAIIEVVKDIVNSFLDPSRFLRTNSNFKEVQELYSKRTADDIISSGLIINLNKNDPNCGTHLIHGCIDYATAITALMRVLNIPAKFIRLYDHSVVEIDLEGKKYILDPLDRDKKTVRAVDAEWVDLVRLDESDYGYAEGLDAHDPLIGIYNWEDYKKFIKGSKDRDSDFH